MENVPDVHRVLWPTRWLPDDRCGTVSSPAPARQLSVCSGSYADPSLATLLRCFAVKTLAVSQY